MRYEKGREMLEKVDGIGGARVIESLKDIAPDLGKYIVEFVFGDIYTREGLNLQEREIISLASLLSIGDSALQIGVHINGALNVGIEPRKIIEIFIQCIPYTGFPRVLNAVNVAKKVFAERNITV